MIFFEPSPLLALRRRWRELCHRPTCAVDVHIVPLFPLPSQLASVPTSGYRVGMEIDPSNLGIGGVVGGILVALAFLITKLPKLLGGSAEVVKAVPPTTSTPININNTTTSEADATGRHSIAPAPIESDPGDLVCERKCAERRSQLAEADSRSGEATERLEKKIDDVKADLTEIKVSVAALTASVDTMAKAAQRESDGLRARVERLESAAR